jgi:hypothetical protein
VGTYSDLSIADYPVILTKGGVSSVVMTVFRESDKRTFKRLSDDREVPWETPNDDEDAVIVCQYCNTARNIKQRLDIMGFSLKGTQDDFKIGIAKKIEDLKEYIFDSGGDDVNPELALLKNSGFDDWLGAIHYILANKLAIEIEYRQIPSELYPPLVRYMLNSADYKDDDGLYHFPCSDVRYLIRAFLEVCDSEDLIVQDISHLVSGGYYEFQDEVCNLSIAALTSDYPLNSKIVILTEGSTDKFALEASLKLLYPHLYDYYSFMDFNLSNSQGGASFLVQTVRAFVGSGITNRIIAVFDNDTVGSNERSMLLKTAIPDNIKVISYPEIVLARDYPTIGPTGISRMDINGLACSIELYFGVDILRKSGELALIQWKGYNESINQYQGEILGKTALQAAFRSKVERCTSDPTTLNTTAWNEMRMLWQHIFDCYS